MTATKTIPGTNHANVIELHKDIDALVRVMRLSQKGFNPPCAQHCHHCCHEAVFCNSEEAEYILDGLYLLDGFSDSAGLLDEVTARTRKWLEQFEANGLLKAEYNNEIGILWRKAHVPCPFLKDGQCIVYDRRPTGCRVFFAFDNPENCAMPMRVHQKFAMIEQHPMFLAALAKYFLTIRRTRQDHLGVHLAMRLLNKPDLESGTTQIIEIQQEKTTNT